MTSYRQWILDRIILSLEYVPSREEIQKIRDKKLTCFDVAKLYKKYLNATNKLLSIKVILMAASGFLIIFSSGKAYSLIAKKCKPGLEKTDGQCIDPFLQPYQKATEQADKALLLAKDYKSISDLQTAQLNLNDAVKQLRHIPTEAPIYSATAIKLTEYEQSRKAISKDIDDENIAFTKLQESEKIAEEAKSQANGERKLAELKLAREKLSEAKETLQEIDFNSLVIAQAQAHSLDYDLKIQNIDCRLAKSLMAAIARNTHEATSKKNIAFKQKNDFAPRTNTVNSNCIFH